MIRLADAEGTQWSFDGDVVRIGRAEDADVTIEAEHVSGEHASIVFNGESYVLRDHHSTNGTRVVRGEDVVDVGAQTAREFVLEPGDEILLGPAGDPVRLQLEISVDDEDDQTRIVEVRAVSELDEIEAKVGSDGELLQALYRAQKAISTAVEMDEVIDRVSEQVFEFLTRATHVAVALRESDDPGDKRKSVRYVPVGTRLRDGDAGEGPIPITQSVFRKVVKERAAVLAADAKSEVGETASLMAAQILSTIGVPLWQGDAIIGVLQVDNRASKGIFRPQDLDVVALLAQSMSQAFVRARMLQRLRLAEERQRTENEYLKQQEEHRRFDGMIGESQAMQELFTQLRKVVDTRVTILIEGETGTGKELIASAAHYWSDRKEKLFVAQNCAAMPENLLESELFGHKRGAFTGASQDKKGLFELADGGTLFLDEIGEMPIGLQPKLLRALQEGEIRPVGASKPKQVDVRTVAATNRNLEKEVAEGRFREDLFYRLNVFPLRLPPLRDRRDDIPLLANHFLQRYTEEFGRSIRGFSQPAMELFQAYSWPGNVRELENEVQRLVIQVDDEEFVDVRHLSPKARQVENVIGRVKPTKGTLKEMVEQVEKWILREALNDHNNNKSATAKTLGITREGLHKKLKNYGMT